MDRFDIVINLIVAGPIQYRSIKCLIDFFNEKSTTLLNRDFKKLSYSYSDNLKEKKKVVSFNSKNIQNYYNIVKKHQSDSFEVFLPSENWELLSRDTDISFLLHSIDDARQKYSLVFQLNGTLLREFITEDQFKTFIFDIIQFFQSQKIDIFYGAVFPMETKKFPKFFVSGIESEKLTKEERQLTNLWSHCQDRCDKKIWDIFWINIFSIFHTKNENLLNEIEEVIGNNLVININDSNYMISLPINILQFEQEISLYKKYKIRLKKVFKKYNMIMVD